ncbi:MAG: peptidoglycan DD-metalloendopeptidase family protein [Bacilli bacterium]|nr:peptidoglycan DD-metalloendopeptidase family protein [Bacilli bacterium]
MRKAVKILLILVICYTLIPYNASAITLGDYEAKLQKFKDEAAANQTAINKTQEEINATNREISNIKTEMQNLANEVVRLKQEIEDYNKEIKDKSLQTKEIFEYFQMSSGENIYLEYAFGAETITDLIYRMAIVEQMTEYNNKVTKELEEMIEKNKQREKEIEKLNVELNEKQKAMEQKLISLGNTKASLTEGGSSIQNQVKSFQEQVNYYKGLGCKSHHVIGVDCATSGAAGVFRRPTMVGYITSEFGSRWGSFHRGLDISNGDPYNTKIYPVANGTVVDKYYDYYGALCVAIEHYDAINNKYYTSLYAHLNSFAPGLKIGQYVTSDTYIGYMGNSGYSTGPHLHLEINACRWYVDYSCRNWDAHVSYMKVLANNGYKGPRQLISFPDGTYNPWYSR